MNPLHWLGRLAPGHDIDQPLTDAELERAEARRYAAPRELPANAYGPRALFGPLPPHPFHAAADAIAALHKFPAAGGTGCPKQPNQ